MSKDFISDGIFPFWWLISMIPMELRQKQKYISYVT